MTARGTRAAAGGVLLLVLAAGFFLGLVWSRRSPEQAESAASAAAAAPGADEENQDRERDTRRRGLIVERVGLSAEQKVRVDSVVGHARGMMRQLRADYRAGYGELIEATRSSIKDILTPGQAAEYDALLEDFDRRRSEDREREEEPAEARERDGDDQERSSRGSRDRGGRGRDEGEWDEEEWSRGF